MLVFLLFFVCGLFGELLMLLSFLFLYFVSCCLSCFNLLFWVVVFDFWACFLLFSRS